MEGSQIKNIDLTWRIVRKTNILNGMMIRWLRRWTYLMAFLVWFPAVSGAVEPVNATPEGTPAFSLSITDDAYAFRLFSPQMSHVFLEE